MPDTPLELLKMRELWARLDALEEPRITQAQVVRRARTIAHLVPGAEDGLSGPYISQLLNATLDRDPSRPRLVVLALALHAVFEANATAFEDQENLATEFSTVMTDLKIQPTTWTSSGPLMPYSENLVVFEKEEQRAHKWLEESGFAIAVTGPARCGKTSLVARLVERCVSRNIKICQAQVGTFIRDVVSRPDLFSKLAAALELGGSPPSDAVEFEKAVEAWLKPVVGKAVIVIDDVNALLDVDGSADLVRNIFRGWHQLAARSGSSSAWRKFNLIIATTYAPDVARSPSAIRSTAYADMTVLRPPGFDEDQILELMRLHLEHSLSAREVKAVGSRDDIAAGLRNWTNGHAFLVHASVANWVEELLGRDESAPERWPDSPEIEDFVRTLRRNVQTINDDPEGGITEIKGADGQAYRCRGPAQSLLNVGIIDHDRKFVSPFIEARIGPELELARS